MINFNLDTFKLYTANPPLRAKKNSDTFQKQQGNKAFSNLAPLAKDTISFTSNQPLLNKTLFDAFRNKEICTQINENAAVAEADLKKVIIGALKPLIATKSNPQGCIYSISTRVKSPNSLREKIASEFEYAATENKDRFFNPLDIESIKSRIGDVVGMRITLREASNSHCQKIINAIIGEIEQERINVVSIDSHENTHTDTLNYFSQSSLEKLLAAANAHRRPGQKPVELFHKRRDTGYMALHLNLDLSNQDYLVKNNDYKAEIQILGYDVEKLKDVEDFCYKLNQGKVIKGGHEAYSAFDKYYHKYLNDNENYPNLEQDFAQYTSKAYCYQRKRQPIRKLKGKDKSYELPTIAQCAMQGKIPPELDFNRLAKIKHTSDELYQITENI